MGETGNKQRNRLYNRVGLRMVYGRATIVEGEPPRGGDLDEAGNHAGTCWKRVPGTGTACAKALSWGVPDSTWWRHSKRPLWRQQGEPEERKEMM